MDRTREECWNCRRALRFDPCCVSHGSFQPHLTRGDWIAEIYSLSMPGEFEVVYRKYLGKRDQAGDRDRRQQLSHGETEIITHLEQLEKGNLSAAKPDLEVSRLNIKETDGPDQTRSRSRPGVKSDGNIAESFRNTLDLAAPANAAGLYAILAGGTP